MKLLLVFSLFIILKSIDLQASALKLRWGILSAGRISNDFILSMKNFDKADHEIEAIASRNITKAKNYADKFGIPKFYENYADLAKDKDVNVVYVATINPHHFSAVKLMLESKKHVLCEKPMVVHPEDARELFKIAKDNNVVLMEALWSRFLPAYIQATEMINNGTIGKLEHVSSHQLLTGASLKRLSNLNLAGGIALDIGIYSLHAILTAVNFTRPEEFKVVGRKLAENATDCTVTGIMRFANGVTASFVMTSVTSPMVNRKLSHVAYIGNAGYIKLPYPMNGPDDFEVNDRKINAQISDNQTGYNWPTSAGLRFQANEIKKVIEENRLTSDLMPPEYTYLFADLVQEIYNQLNITFPATLKNYEFNDLL